MKKGYINNYKAKYALSYGGDVDNFVLSASNFDEVVLLAYKDGVTRLYLSQEEFDLIERLYFFNGGAYDWKEKTLAGMELVVYGKEE